MLAFLLTHYHYVIVVVLMMTGLYVVFASGNMVKRLIGLSVFQTSVFLFYVTLGKVAGGKPPILPEKGHGDDHGGGHEPASPDSDGHGESLDAAVQAAEPLYSNPLPHVLILTAIVVGVATLAVGLALVVRIREAYGGIEDEIINLADSDTAQAGGRG
ncbi:MAG: cation:proton antiporter subunit C [Maricaulaceae bacterium]